MSSTTTTLTFSVRQDEAAKSHGKQEQSRSNKEAAAKSIRQATNDSSSFSWQYNNVMEHHCREKAESFEPLHVTQEK